MALAGDPAIGAALAGLGGCAACHTADGGPPWAGGHAVETPRGTFYGSNLTPDPEHGLGAWGFDDFRRAMREGRAPDGHAYWPAFPYTSFTNLTDEDLGHLWAFLQTLEPVARPDQPHEGIPPRWQLQVFRWRAFHEGPEPLDRGAYLGTAVGHCRECHSPRTWIGRIRTRHELEGGHAPFTVAPAIDPEALAGWSADDLDTLFTLGMSPDGDFPGGGMSRIVDEG
ncbi:MAG: c-type cytochrome, partial [Myxococcales bacterium]|nr:c-type cytochrome [Myxococcales bacterium]